MRRHILGVFAATVAAPYLVVFMDLMFELMFTDSPGVVEPLDLLKALPLGTFGLFLFGGPVLMLSGICAVVLNLFGLRSTWWAIIGGATVGLCFAAILFSASTESTPEDQLLIVPHGVV